MKQVLKHAEKIMSGFEVVIGALILVAIIIRTVEVISHTVGAPLHILQTEFETILSLAFGLIIGIEFTKMLYRHTPESVIDVLLFALARQMVIYNEQVFNLLIGVVAIVILFAARKFLVSRRITEEEEAKDETFERR
jgi:hypothetical protein